jgi:hypothetical protein
LFIKEVDHLFSNLEEIRFININHISHINPEIIIQRKPKPVQIEGNNRGIYGVISGNGIGSGSGNGSGNGIVLGGDNGVSSGYSLGNRKVLNKIKLENICQEEGRVAVQVIVDRNGNTIKATAGVQGTTNITKCLLDQAQNAAMNTKWQADYNAPETQIGKIIYTFSLN